MRITLIATVGESALYAQHDRRRDDEAQRPAQHAVPGRAAQGLKAPVR